MPEIGPEKQSCQPKENLATKTVSLSLQSSFVAPQQHVFQTLMPQQKKLRNIGEFFRPHYTECSRISVCFTRQFCSFEHIKKVIYQVLYDSTILKRTLYKKKFVLQGKPYRHKPQIMLRRQYQSQHNNFCCHTELTWLIYFP